MRGNFVLCAMKPWRVDSHTVSPSNPGMPIFFWWSVKIRIWGEKEFWRILGEIWRPSSIVVNQKRPRKSNNLDHCRNLDCIFNPFAPKRMYFQAGSYDSDTSGKRIKNVYFIQRSPSVTQSYICNEHLGSRDQAFFVHLKDCLAACRLCAMHAVKLSP